MVFFLIVLVALGIGLAVAVKSGVLDLSRFLGAGARRDEVFRAKRPLTPREQAMFWRLSKAFPQPGHVVLSQVGFGAFLSAGKGTSHQRFNQKRADFVILDKSFTVLAVIELDDSSHSGNEQRDAARDGMLQSAGLRVLRYAQVPEVDQLVEDVARPAGATGERNEAPRAPGPVGSKRPTVPSTARGTVRPAAVVDLNASRH